MIIEHLIYSLATAILAGMIHFRYFGRDYSWIIVISAYAPDSDIIFDFLRKTTGLPMLISGHPITHSAFHNIAALTLFSICMAFLLNFLGFKFLDSVVFACVGFGAHLLEDALVFSNDYAYFWPLEPSRTGIGLFDYSLNFYELADNEVLIIGLALLFISIILRTVFEGPRWPAKYLPKR